MKPPFVRVGRAAVVCALLGMSTSTMITTLSINAGAQPPPPAPPPASTNGAITPPKLKTQVEAIDPRPTDVDVERASVEIEIEIDANGLVSEARALRSSGNADLDAAAIGAVKQFVFEPATRDGKPMAAKIRYEYVFAARQAAPPSTSPSPPQAPVVEAPKTASISGVVRDRAKGAPLANADVLVTTDANAKEGRPSMTYRTKTDANGAFRIDGVDAGPVHLVVTAEGRSPGRLDETLEPGTITEATLRLDEAPDPEAFGATARVEGVPREVTKRSLGTIEMKSVAGTRGDPLRAVELLPGVSRPQAGGGLPILRGANPADTQVFLEGAPVPNLYHLGGLTSFMHSRVLESVDVYPSNFSVRYGRKVGGVIEARVRDPKSDKIHGIAEVSFLDSSLLVETPIGEKFSALAAVRRSNLDAVLNTASGLGDIGITAAPVYWDYQAIAAFKPTDKDRIRVISYGSSDRFGILLDNPAEVDPIARGQFDISSVFHRVQLGYRHRWSGGSEQNTELTYGNGVDRGAFGDIGRFRFVINTIQGRTEWIGVVSPAFRVVAGIDALNADFRGHYTGTPPTAGEGENPNALSLQRRIDVNAAQWVSYPGAYVEAGIRPIPALLLTPGVRADYNSFVEKAAVDPRMSARFDVTDQTTLKAGVGRFSQSPEERHVAQPIGNANLGMTHAIHASAGVEHKVTDNFSASVEGFGKWIDDVVTSTPNGRPPFFINGQEGRIFGGELLLRVKPTGRFFGFLSYTLMRSERRDEGQPWRLFDRDQTHILGASGVYRLGRGWEVGATVRYTSGTPYTPVTGATYDGTTDVYSPRLGRPMSARNPAFSRLDLRIQKTWTFSAWSLAAYLDVQNVLNSPNREGFNYSYDYRRREGAAGLPILPILGVRGEL